MAILLKEITIRYSPKGDNLFQLLKDYYSVFGLWQRTRTGDIVNQRKQEIIDDVMHQVGKMTHVRMLKRIREMDHDVQEKTKKDIQKLNHAGTMEDWTNFTGALTDVVKNSTTWDRSGDLTNLWRDANKAQVSPSIGGLFGSAPKTPEPKWKQFDKPMDARGSLGGTQRDLPMAGGQTDLPLTPREKLPQMQKDLPPLPIAMASGQTKRVGGNWESVLKSFGYEWSDTDHAYKNEGRNVKFQVKADNSVKVFLPSGKEKDIPNLGMLFRALNHNKKKRHAGEPAASVTKENYKGLYEFLYT